ncbi:MAG: hypothetical protein KDB60_18005 [Propionibacteriaceae bacterium]|nr:hypothetical protein [Propionibacteriaceae bacterium]
MRSTIRTALGWVALGGPILALVLWTVGLSPADEFSDQSGRAVFLFTVAGLSFTVGALALTAWIVLVAMSREHLAPLEEIRSLRQDVAELRGGPDPGADPPASGQPSTV